MIWSTTKSKYKKIKKWQELGNTQAREKLVMFINKEAETSLKSEAVKALGSIPNKKVVAPLIIALKNESPQARATAAEALGRHAHPDAVEPLVQCLNDPDDVVRMKCAEALGRIGDARAVDGLIKTLEDKEWSAHWAAAFALGRIADPRAINPLLVWVEKILSAAARKLSVSEKLDAVRDVLMHMFGKADDSVLHALAENLIMSVRINSWEVTNRQTGEAGWIKRTYENPIWSLIKYELGERKAKQKAAEEEARAAQSTPETTAMETAPPVAPPPAAESEEMMPLRQIALPRIEGSVGEFLKFLKEKSLTTIVVIGGAVRDLALGRKPTNFDITIKIIVPDQIRPRVDEPMDWNMAFIEKMDKSLDRLAEAFDVSIADLLDGKAVFTTGGESFPVRWVGPYFFEEEESGISGLRFEQLIRRCGSRLALVADHESGQALGLLADATINRMWIDTHGHWGRNCKKAMLHLQDRQIHLDGSPETMGLTEIFRLLAARHKTEFSLAGHAYDAIIAAVAKLKAHPEMARLTYSGESFDRLIASADFEMVVEELELLDLVPVLTDCLEPPMLEKVNKLLAKRNSEWSGALKETEKRCEAMIKEAERLKEIYEKKLAKFCKHIDHLDESKTTKYDIEARLADSSQKLAEVEQQWKQAAARLEQATKNLRGFKPDDSGQTNPIQEHREALAAKRERDAALEKIRKEVEQLKTAVERKYQAGITLQEEIEQMGSDVEKATNEYREAEAAATRALEELEEQRAESALSEERRKAMLCGMIG